MKATVVVCKCGHSRRWHRGDRGHCTRRGCSCVVLRPSPERVAPRARSEEKIAEHVDLGIAAVAALNSPGREADAFRFVKTLASEGPAVLYGTCCGWAELIGRGDRPEVERPKGPWGIDAFTEDGSRVESLDAVNPVGVWVVRFLAAYLSGDHPTAFALFWAPVEAEDIDGFWQRVFALLELAAGVAAQVIEQRRQEAGGG